MIENRGMVQKDTIIAITAPLKSFCDCMMFFINLSDMAKADKRFLARIPKIFRILDENR